MIRTLGAAVGALIVILFLVTVAAHLSRPIAETTVSSSRP